MIRNLTRNTLIARNPVILTSLIGHMLGLMFKKKIIPHVLLFRTERHVSLHTFFVAGPIDLIFVNKQNRVVEIKENLTPFSFYSPYENATAIIEAKSGTVRKTRTKINDTIKYNL
ncbi:MAG: DUF192 domain-containing protein [Candidatus Aenigmarchaeota archaeon]|nr:DUF192 domain-containing protein [Candidatus Aenigmarchaeota archaeon]